MRNVIIMLLCLTLLSGCSKQEEPVYSGSTFILEVPINSTEVYEFSLPTELSIVETDNNNFWKFSDGSELYCLSTSSINDATYDEATDLYVTYNSMCKQFEECCIIIKTKATALRPYLASGSFKNKRTELYRELELKHLPAYKEQEMAMTDANLYMPLNSVDHQVNAFMVSMVSNGNSWLESWVIDGTLDDIKDSLCTLALNNSNKDMLDSWYLSDDVIYLTSGSNIVGAKKLRYNEWYVYYGDVTYKDYILQGLDKIHAD